MGDTLEWCWKLHKRDFPISWKGSQSSFQGKQPVGYLVQHQVARAPKPAVSHPWSLLHMCCLPYDNTVDLHFSVILQFSLEFTVSISGVKKFVSLVYMCDVIPVAL